MGSSYTRTQRLRVEAKGRSYLGEERLEDRPLQERN
jgi:hypothetical protein